MTMFSLDSFFVGLPLIREDRSDDRFAVCLLV